MVKFIYFDVGGVTMLDYSGTNKWHKMKRDMGIDALNDAAYELIWKRYGPVICTTCDVDTIIPILTEELGITFPSQYSILLDFVNRFERNISIWPVIESAKLKAKVGLLTNMYPRMLDILRSRELIPPTGWEVIIDSSIERVQKPDAAIYELAESRAGVLPHEILFIDNTIVNIAAAKERGWLTFHYDSTRPETSSKALETYIDHSI